MEFAEFAARADDIERETADLEITTHVASLLCEAGSDLPVVVRFLQGRVFPAWDSTTLAVGPTLCYEAIARAAGQNVTAADVETRLAERGEIGAVAESYEFGGQRGLAAFGTGDGRAGLSVADVDSTLREVAAATGAGSEDRKLNALFGLFNRTSSVESRYLARLVLSEMRIGVGEGTVRDAVAEAFDAPVETVERALQVTNDYGRVATLARDEGASGLRGVGLTIGRPVQAMLAQSGAVDDALDEWGETAVETKYDGARVQVHHDPRGGVGDRIDGDRTGDAGVDPDDRVRVFSRNMEDVTDALPEVVELVERTLATPAILDGEVVAIDDGGDPLPFQEVLRRFRRKHEVDRAREEVAVEFRAFDCLHAGVPESNDSEAGGASPTGEDLLDAPLVERRDRLASLFDDRPGRPRDREGDAREGSDTRPAEIVSPLALSTDPDEIAEIEAAALAAGHEGIMLKDPTSSYTPGRRGKRWLKRKPDVETLDLVVTGAEWGEGRRANHLGTFLLSARIGDAGDGDDADEAFATIGKVATGITDEELADLTDLLEPEIRAQDGQEVDLRPAVVFEVGYEEIQRSPTYSSGYALRFPRFRAVRDDKAPADADTLARVRRLADRER